MGIYSSNRTGLGNYSGENIMADESYNGIIGCYNALIDMERNNRAIFEFGIARDFQEAIMLNEGADEEELYAFSEASLSGIFESFKAMIKKIWEKIKGIFNTFIRKLDTVIIRDNKKFVDKYQRQVRAKNLSKLKYKYCKRLDGFDILKSLLDPGTGFNDAADEILATISTDKKFEDEEKRKIDDGEAESEFIEAIIGVKNVEMKDLAKEIHEFCFETEDSEEGLDSSRLTDIILILQGDKTKSDVEKAQRNVNKHFSKIMKILDKYSKTISKYKFDDKNPTTQSYKFGDDIKDDKGNIISNTRSFSNKEEVSNELSKVGYAQRSMSALENVHNRVVACFLNEHKFNITQARKVFSKAVSYNDKAKNESVYLDALEEAAEYEINEMFENYEF